LLLRHNWAAENEKADAIGRSIAGSLGTGLWLAARA